MKLVTQGAEAKIYKQQDSILKHRFPKTYRHPALDLKLQKLRTRHEASILKKLESLDFPAPRVLSVDEKEGKIEIEFIKGELLKDVLQLKHAAAIGKVLATLHNHHIIHGDLTTSNMIINSKLYFIDFGLSFVSRKIEDKAVDLHLLDRALESKHYRTYPAIFMKVLTSYRKYGDDGDRVVKRLEQVHKRGRYKGKH